MKLTLLLDLDDTLLTNPLDAFMPVYIKLLSGKLAGVVPAEKMVPRLLHATERMIANLQPTKTLEQVFDEDFYPALALKKADLEPILHTFYSQDFNALKTVTRPKKGAQELIEFGLSQRARLIVATNPLFPLSAMHARLMWAGFTVTEFPFEVVTSYESMHFAKPNIAYYAEIMGMIGWPEGPCCMIGNSLKDDILPAASLGIPGFWVDGTSDLLPEPIISTCSAGSLEDVLVWLKQIRKNPFCLTLRDPQAVLAVLTTTAVSLQRITASLDENGWKQRDETTKFSILELISHLRDVEEEINQARIQRICEVDNPFISGIDSDAWITERDYQQTRDPSSLNDFESLRLQSIDLLRSLSMEDWSKPARHSFFGPTTLLELVRFMALHDIDHIRQIWQMVNANDR